LNNRARKALKKQTLGGGTSAFSTKIKEKEADEAEVKKKEPPQQFLISLPQTRPRLVCVSVSFCHQNK
jgi:hypothetical protein